jgi:hypothetical protein
MAGRVTNRTGRDRREATSVDAGDQILAVLPTRIGPVEFSTFGGWVAVRCPIEFEEIMRRAGAYGNRDRAAGLSSVGVSGR